MSLVCDLWWWHPLETPCSSALVRRAENKYISIHKEHHTTKLQSIMISLALTTVNMVEVHLYHLSPLCSHTTPVSVNRCQVNSQTTVNGNHYTPHTGKYLCGLLLAVVSPTAALRGMLWLDEKLSLLCDSGLCDFSTVSGESPVAAFAGDWNPGK